MAAVAPGSEMLGPVVLGKAALASEACGAEKCEGFAGGMGEVDAGSPAVPA